MQYKYDWILVNDSLYFEMFFCNFWYFTRKPFTYVAFEWNMSRHCKAKYLNFLIFQVD